MGARVLRLRRPFIIALGAVAIIVAGLSGVSAALAGGSDEDETPVTRAQKEKTVAEEKGDEADEDGAILLQADTVTYDADADIVYAKDNVELVYDDRVLKADSITYYQTEDKVIASGNVSIEDETGNIVFADRIELEDRLREGVVESFSALLSGPSRISAARGLRRDGNVNELNRATFSSCDVCDEAGNPRTPLWQIRAFRVIQNEEELTITYRDAFFEFFGVPIFYLPYFSHPDPSVERKSGFLVPTVGDSDRLGFFLEVPYHFAFSPYYDLTLRPRYTTEDGLLMQGDWRQRTRAGRYDMATSFIYTDERTAGNRKTGDKTLRGHLWGEGTFAVNETWDWGYQVQLVSQDTYLRRYDISNEVDLENRLFTRAISGRNYLDVGAYYFQGLRVQDDPGQSPLVLPMIRGQYVVDAKKYGRIFLSANALVLQRSEGSDTRRLSVGADWRRELRTRNGQLITPFAQFRVDAYHVNDINPEELAGLPTDSDVIYRTLPTAGVEWRWPFARPVSKSMYVIIEPIAQVVVSHDGGNPDEIPNEDSQSFEFDTSNLFRANRSPGLDLWENGQRLNLGAKVGAYWDDAREVSFAFGRSFRSNDESPFAPETGLHAEGSDYVGSLTVKPVENFSLTHRFRIDDDSLSFRRNEVDANFNWWRVAGRATYLSADRVGPDVGIPKREEIRLNGRLQFSKNWRLSLGTIRDLEIQETRQTVGSLVYEDECTIFTISATRHYFNDRDIRPSDSIYFNLVLKQLN